MFSNIVVMMKNHGDRELNQRILRKLGYSEYAKSISRDFSVSNIRYVVINLSAELESNQLRLSTNLFSENSPFCTK